MSRKQVPNHYISGHYGDPPATLPQDYLLVLIQIGRRMWKDIGVVLVLSLLIAAAPIPKSWLLSGKAVIDSWHCSLNLHRLSQYRSHQPLVGSKKTMG